MSKSITQDMAYRQSLMKYAEKYGVSRSLISTIEAPNMAHGFSLDVFFDIADALEVDPADLINASVFPDRIIKSK